MQRTPMDIKSDIKSWFWVLALAALIALGPDALRAESPTPNEVQSGSLLLRMEGGYSIATLLNTDVNMNVSGLVARVSVRQEFRNTSQDWVEGVYVFPLPDKAAVDRMRLHIGEPPGRVYRHVVGCVSIDTICGHGSDVVHAVGKILKVCNSQSRSRARLLADRIKIVLIRFHVPPEGITSHGSGNRVDHHD